MDIEQRAAFEGEIEIRQAGRLMVGSFRYGSMATIAKTGRIRKERFTGRAFRHAVEDADREINILVGHDYGKPIASKRAGTLRLVDGDDALRFEADLPEVGQRPSWVEDAVRSIESKLMRQLSPSFVVAPRSINPNAEKIIPEPGNPGVAIREITDATLLEMSLVTRGSYTDGTDVSLRAEDLRGQHVTNRLKRKCMIWLSR